jgi:hypothetical protein
MQSSDPTTVSSEALARKHESVNPPMRGVLIGAAAVVGTTVACLVIIWFLMSAFAKVRPLDPAIAQRGIILAPDEQMLTRFPAPSLQVNPRVDLAAWRERETAALERYAWIDRSNGIVRLPIERAMDLLLERGLPVRSSNAPARLGKSRLELRQERATQR